MEIECTHCGKHYMAPASLAGKRIRCRDCGEMFDIPVDAAIGFGDEADGAFGKEGALDVSGSGEEDSGPRVRSAEGRGQLRDAWAETTLERSGEVDPFDLAFEGAVVVPSFRPNRPFIYPNGHLVDRFLPWVLMVGGLGWVLSLIFSENASDPLWTALLQAAVYVGALGLIAWPLAWVGVRMASARQRYELPDRPAWRVFAVSCVPFALGMAMWLAGGAIGSLVTGVFIGLILCGPLLWLLLRLELREIPVTLGYAAGGFLIGAVVAGGLIGITNTIVLHQMNQSGSAVQFAFSPLGKNLPWDAVAPAAKPRPGHKTPSRGHSSSGAKPPGPSHPGPAHVATTQPPALVVGPDSSTSRPAGHDAGELFATIAPQDPRVTTGPVLSLPKKESGLKPAAPKAPGGSAEPGSMVKEDSGVADSSGGGSMAPDSEKDDSSVAGVPTPASAFVSQISVLPIKTFDSLLLPQAAGEWMVVLKQRGAAQDTLERWSLSPAEKKGTAVLRHDNDRRDPYVLSGDGAMVGRIITWPQLAAQVWSFETKQAIDTIPLNSQNGAPEILSLGNQIVIRWEKGRRFGIEVRNVGPARQPPPHKPFTTPQYEKSVAGMAVSPDGRWLAAAGRSDRGDAQIELYPLSGNWPVTALAIPQLDSRWPVAPAGMSFSPDGRQIAVFFEHNDVGLIMVWRMSDRHLVAERAYLNGFGIGSSPIRRNYAGSGLTWIADGKAFLLFGHTLVDARSLGVLGELGVPDVCRDHVIDPQTLLLERNSPGGPHQALRVELNAEKLDQVRQALKK